MLKKSKIETSPLQHPRMQSFTLIAGITSVCSANFGKMAFPHGDVTLIIARPISLDSDFSGRNRESVLKGSAIGRKACRLKKIPNDSHFGFFP